MLAISRIQFDISTWFLHRYVVYYPIILYYNCKPCIHSTFTKTKDQSWRCLSQIEKCLNAVDLAMIAAPKFMSAASVVDILLGQLLWRQLRDVVQGVHLSHYILFDIQGLKPQKELKAYFRSMEISSGTLFKVFN